MQKPLKVAIVGGGASGLLCLLELICGKNALDSQSVALFERNDRIGQKLIATGNGQGNLSNKDLSVNHYFGEKRFLETFVDNCNKINIEKYFYGLGIPFITDEAGRSYPVSKQASAVLDIIRLKISSLDGKVFTGTHITSVVKKDNVFELRTSSQVFYAEKVVLAVGGKCAKQFGTDGTSYALAQGFGHKLTALYPSLVQLKTQTDAIRSLKGLKERAKVYAYDGDAYLSVAEGDLLFTEFGVSGNSIFKISPYVVTAKKPILRIEFLPQFSKDEVVKFLEDRKKTGYFDNENLLTGLINKRVGQALLKTLRDKSPKSVANAVKDFRLNVTGNLGFNYAQVTKGGIYTKDFFADSYESKLCADLYGVGEMLDVDGDCGGYNLTFAFVSGIVSAQSIKKKIGEKV